MNTPTQELNRIHDPTIHEVYVGQVLEVIPTADRELVSQLIRENVTPHGESAVGIVLALLLEGEEEARNLGIVREATPEPANTGVKEEAPARSAEKRKREETEDEDEDAPRAKPRIKGEMDYTNEYRENVGGPNYVHWAKRQLYEDHPHLKQKHIDLELKARKNLYAPTDIHLTQDWNSRSAEEQREIMRPTKWYTVPKNLPLLVPDEEFNREREWLIDYKSNREKDRVKVAKRKIEDQAIKRLVVEGRIKDPELKVAKTEDEDKRIPKPLAKEQKNVLVKAEEDPGATCMACSASKPLDEFAQCEDAHLFCRTCFCDHASTYIKRNERLVPCILAVTCVSRIGEDELLRVLPLDLLASYNNIGQPREGDGDVIDLGGLPVEKCPFCPNIAFVEEESGTKDDRRFWCSECNEISCRDCKRRAKECPCSNAGGKSSTSTSKLTSPTPTRNQPQVKPEPDIDRSVLQHHARVKAEVQDTWTGQFQNPTPPPSSQTSSSGARHSRTPSTPAPTYRPSESLSESWTDHTARVKREQY